MGSTPKVKGKRSTMSELDQTEDEIKKCYERLHKLERNLDFQPLTADEREGCEKDVLELKKILMGHEEELRALRKDNQSSTFISVVLIIATFLIFGIYKMLK